MNTGQLAALAEVEEIVIVEEELGADVVRAGIDFGFEIVHLGHAVGCLGVSFREAGHPDPEPAAGMAPRLVE